jgi:cold shock CspA family protein
MTYAGKDYEAWLLEDGKLQWDDGDVWVRRGKEASESIDRTWKAVNTAEAEVTALDPGAKQHLRFPCDQRHKQNTVPARQTASSQRHGVASASVWRPSDLRRHSSQPKDGPVLARSKGPVENVSSYAAVAASQAPTGDGTCQRRQGSVVVSEPRSKTRYEGNIKYFRGSYGWVYSPDVQKEFGGADVFLHVNDCGDGFRPRQGDAVTFQLSKDQKGNPKAVQALPPVAKAALVMIDAHEWFEKRQRSSLR